MKRSSRQVGEVGQVGLGEVDNVGKIEQIGKKIGQVAKVGRVGAGAWTSALLLLPTFVGACSVAAANPQTSRPATAEGHPANEAAAPPSCQTRYAIVPAGADQIDCHLSADLAADWAVVPIPSPGAVDGQPAPAPVASAAVRRASPRGDGFCVYHWRDGTSRPDTQAFNQLGGQPDCPIVAKMAAVASKRQQRLPPNVWEPLVRTFEKQARGFRTAEGKALYAQRAKNGKVPVRVAVVDGTGNAGSVHATAVRSVISSLFCPEGDKECHERIVPRAPTPAATDKPDDCQESVPGFIPFHQLYDGIAEAIGPVSSKPSHLVLNLSLGWDPIKLDRNDPNLKRIVELLERASCMGALVVAAAGNVTGTDGPLLPAGYEVRRAPSAERCAEFKLPAPPKERAKYAPLLQAVGAVDALDQRLLSVRRWGEPRLAAYGLAVTAPSTDDVPYSPPLTGTSMSAGIVAAIAGAVWQVRPDLDASQVMALVYDGGVPLDGGPISKRALTEFCLDQPFGPCREWSVHRAVLCGALAKALPDDKWACAPTGPAEKPDLPKVPKGTVRDKSIKAPPPCRITGCGKSVGPLAVQLPDGALPQPTVAGCPTCTLTKNLYNDGWDLLWGYPTSIPRSLYSTIVRTYDENWEGQDYNVTNPAKANELYGEWMVTPRNTYAAEMYWYFSVGGANVKDVTPLIVVPSPW